MREPICITIPFHADLSYLETALRSLIGQRDLDWTAIVVDDASPQPGASQVVAALGDDRIDIVRNDTNLGIAANFNRCLELGANAAAIVTIFHADDVLEPGYVSSVRAAHSAFPDAACVAPRATVIGGDGHPKRTLADTTKALLWPRRLPFVLEGDRGLARLVHGLFFYCPAVSYRVDLLPELRFDGRWQQVMDLDLFGRILLDDGCIVVVGDREYRYRRHDASATAAHTRSSLRSTEEAAVSREIVDAARRRGWLRAVRAGRLRPIVRAGDWLSRRHRTTVL
ncbi:MAG TPA: glycosyltransferase [Ilumatobacteraceae bacterium]